MNGNIEPLDARTNQFADSLRSHTKKLNAIASRLSRSGEDAASESELLTSSAACFAEVDELKKASKELAKEWESASVVVFLELESHLRDICCRHNWRLDGQWPEFIVERGVQVRIDEKKRSVAVGKENRVAHRSIERALSGVVPELIPKSFNAESFMAKLVVVYDRVVANKSNQVAMLDVYKEFVIQTQSARFWQDATSPTFTPFTIDQFRAQFSKMLECGVTSATDGRLLRLFPPLNPKEAVFLYQPSEKRFGFVGRMEFTTA
jgi:hypothetical protein